ncbi:MAG: putative lipoprotein YiaD [Candidatus Ordinivivax streblomastigis]|uniref:Putative lipoprotein YiaD n=1 Tax=Candidatus Ordinivivax streblomastigis TaxID=2540710 RepID=A0A5M8P2M4_9BACT|nr:MAG: putative lipoprotein YiaD [Candidatus Ordinivivax streblomastigis]
MKKVNLFASLLLCVAIVFSGCNASNTVKGTGIGTGAGAAIGAGIGALINGGKGAAWGAGVGAVVGGGAGALIGNKMDKQKKELEAIKDAQVESINDGQAIKVTFDSGILFKSGSSTLSDASRTALTQFANSLASNPDTDVQIVGHTDSQGGDKVNVPLSQKRADSVKAFLETKSVTAGRLTTQGLGSSQPVATEDAKGIQALNRRVEVYILPNAKMIQEAKDAASKK